MTILHEKNILTASLSGDAVLFAPRPLCEEGERALEALFFDGADGVALATAPFMRGYDCDPVTCETDLAHNCAAAVRTQAAKKAGGIDPRMGTFAAAELLHRIRRNGGKTLYAGRVTAAVERADLYPPYETLVLDSLALRLKWGTAGDIAEGIGLVLRALKHPAAYGAQRGRLLGLCLKRAFCLAGLFAGRFGKNKALRNGWGPFYGVWPGFIRGEWETEAPACDGPKVSLITRTCGRPETLRRTLENLRHQSYKNFEIVIVEDGAPHAEAMVKADFADLPIVYHANGVNIGRAANFNKGVSLATGEYLNMLDDDDYLFPEHIALAVAAAQKTGSDMVFMRGMALEAQKLSDAPYAFEVRGKRPLDFPRVDPFTMVRRCVTAENGVFFKKSLCEAVGGMRPELGAHEDWNLWLRMMAAGSYVTLPYTTCFYIVPADAEAEKKRLAGYAKYDNDLLEDEKLVFSLSAAQRRDYFESVIHDYSYLKSIGRMEETLAAEAESARAFLGTSRIRPASFDAYTDDGTYDISGRGLKELYCTLILDFHEKQKAGTLGDYLDGQLAAINARP